MRDSDFLLQLKKEGKIQLVEPSNEISSSYLIKSANCLKSAKLLLTNGLFENSVSEAYYAMYNSVLSLLYHNGIKSETHSGTILLLKLMFQNDSLSSFLADAKDERIDTQYHIVKKFNPALVREIIENAEKFILKINALSDSLNSQDIERIRQRFLEL